MPVMSMQQHQSATVVPKRSPARAPTPRQPFRTLAQCTEMCPPRAVPLQSLTPQMAPNTCLVPSLPMFPSFRPTPLGLAPRPPTAPPPPFAPDLFPNPALTMMPLINAMQSNMTTFDSLVKNTLCSLTQQNESHLRNLTSIAAQHKADIERIAKERAEESERRAREHLELVMEMSRQHAAEREKRAAEQAEMVLRSQAENREFLRQLNEESDKRCMLMLNSIMESDNRRRRRRRSPSPAAAAAAPSARSSNSRRRSNSSDDDDVSEFEEEEEVSPPPRKRACVATKSPETRSRGRKCKKTRNGSE